MILTITIYTLSKLGYHSSLFPLLPLTIRNIFVSLHRIRIAGNSED